MDSMRGKLVLITGANTGIGKETVADLVEMGAKVVLACRSIKKAEEAVAELVGRGLDKSLMEIEQVCLDSFTSLRALTDRLKLKGAVFDVVIANAGLVVGDNRLTEDGFETTFRTLQIVILNILFG